MTKDREKTNVGGFGNAGGADLRGLELRQLRSGALEAKIELKTGTSVLPLGDRQVRLETPPDTVAEIVAEIGRPAGRGPRIIRAELGLTHRLALYPSTSPLWGFLLGFHLRKVTIDEAGVVRIDGKVRLLHLLSVPASWFRRFFPKLDLDLEQMLDGESDEESTVAAAQPGSPGLRGLLAGAGELLDTMVWDFELTSDPTVLRLESDRLQVESEQEPVHVHLAGAVAFDDRGTLRIEVDDTSVLDTGAVDVAVHGRFEVDAAGRRGSGRIAVRGRVDGLRGRFDSHGIKTRFVIESDSEVDVRCDCTLRDGRLGLANGEGRWKLQVDSPGIDLRLGGFEARISFGEAFIETHGGTGFDAGDQVTTRDGSLDLQLRAGDVRIEVPCFDLRIPAGGSVELSVRDARWNGEQLFTAGEVNYELKAGDHCVFAAGAHFEHAAEGLLIHTRETEFGLPLGIEGFPDKIVNPSLSESPAAGRIGSPELAARIREIADAEIRPGNRVELLINGAMSAPKRRQLIAGATESICLQTAIWQDDESGTSTAEAMADAARRGVAVRVIIDGVGNLRSIKDLLVGLDVYKIMRDAGVDLQLYNEFGLDQLAKFFTPPEAEAEAEARSSAPAARGPRRLRARMGESLDLRDPMAALAVFGELYKAQRSRKRAAGAPARGTHTAVAEAEGDDLGLEDLPEIAQLIAQLNYRWHEKYLVVDGKEAVVGGLNIGDAYLFDASVRPEFDAGDGDMRPVWRDTDLYLAGEAAADTYRLFANNWRFVTQQDLPPPPPGGSPGGSEVQMIQHRPRIDHDHEITNFMIEHLKALVPGEKAYIDNAYFIPTAGLASYKQALIDAAGRGADVRVVTNSQGSTDLPQINQAAIFQYRDLLPAGVRIFERTGRKTLHTKAAYFGGKPDARGEPGPATVAIGSWNADNRSASMNSEGLAVVYGDQTLNRQVEEMMLADMGPDVAREVTLEDIGRLPASEEMEYFLVSILSPLF